MSPVGRGLLTEAREEFNRRREEIRRECEDPRGEEKRGWELDFADAFSTSPLFSHVKVKRSLEPGYHLRVYCTAAHDATVEGLEAELRRIWLEELREEVETHVLERGARSLVLDCVTTGAMGEPYISARVRVEDVPLDETAAPDGSDAYLVALFGGDGPEGGPDDGGIQPGVGGSDCGGDRDLEYLG